MAIFQFANCWFTMLVQVWAVLPCFTALLDISLDQSQERPWASLIHPRWCATGTLLRAVWKSGEKMGTPGTTTTSGKRVDTLW